VRVGARMAQTSGYEKLWRRSILTSRATLSSDMPACWQQSGGAVPRWRGGKLRKSPLWARNERRRRPGIGRGGGDGASARRLPLLRMAFLRCLLA